MRVRIEGELESFERRLLCCCELVYGEREICLECNNISVHIPPISVITLTLRHPHY